MSDTGGSQRLKGRPYAETRSAVLDLIRSEGKISRALGAASVVLHRELTPHHSTSPL